MKSKSWKKKSKLAKLERAEILVSAYLHKAEEWHASSTCGEWKEHMLRIEREIKAGKRFEESFFIFVLNVFFNARVLDRIFGL
jgi:hypothetical protein